MATKAKNCLCNSACLLACFISTKNHQLNKLLIAMPSFFRFFVCLKEICHLSMFKSLNPPLFLFIFFSTECKNVFKRCLKMVYASRHFESPDHYKIHSRTTFHSMAIIMMMMMVLCTIYILILVILCFFFSFSSFRSFARSFFLLNTFFDN